MFSLENVKIKRYKAPVEGLHHQWLQKVAAYLCKTAEMGSSDRTGSDHKSTVGKHHLEMLSSPRCNAFNKTAAASREIGR